MNNATDDNHVNNNHNKLPKSEEKRKKYFDLRENYFNESHHLIDEIRWDLRGKN